MRRNTPFIGPRRIAGRHVLAHGDGTYSYLGQRIDHAPGAVASYPWLITWTPEHRDGSRETDDSPTLRDALETIEAVVGVKDLAS
jgi:hypothetical protein